MSERGDYDVVIVGGGLAGLTAALFAARYGRSTLLLEAGVPGGHLVNVERIEDFPGFPDGTAGYDLCPTVQQQAADQGAEFELAEVRRLIADDGRWLVETTAGDYRASAVIVATGSRPRSLDVPGEARLLGKGVSHCASCDGPLYGGQVVGVVGGGDSALQEALVLADHVDRVVLVHRSAALTAQAAYQRRVASHPRIEVRGQTVVEEILGDDVVAGLRVRDLVTGDVAEVPVAGVFVYVGLRPNTDLLVDVLPLTEAGHVPTDAWMRTALPGLLAAGDIRQDSPAQAITSAGEGATAAIAAHRYLANGVWRD